MSSFLFPLTIILLFNSPSHLVMSQRKSQVAPYHHHSSQIVNFSASTSQVNVPQQQNSSSSYSLLSQLHSTFQTQSSSTAKSDDNIPKIPDIHTSQTPTIKSNSTSGNNKSGHDRRNYTDLFANLISASQPSTRLSSPRNRKRAAVSASPLWSLLALDSTMEKAERRLTRKRRSLPTTKPKNGGILQASNSNLSFVQDQEKLVLKLDRNYTPKDIAEYILSTGDERGIIQVVADMVQDGQLMASRDDVILFLETVQRELSKLKALNQLHRPSPPA